MSGSIFDPLYEGVAKAIVGIHAGLEPIFGKTNGYGWALSIVFLTMAVRLVMFPLFVKQIKSQRQLQLMQPKIKELKEKYKNDRQRMNEEMLKLQREHGNPLLGCLPIFAQIPLFIALFRVLNSFRPRLQHPPGFIVVNGVSTKIQSVCNTNPAQDLHHCYTFVPNHGLSQDQVQTIATAKIFGVPLSAAFNSPQNVLKFLGVNSGLVRAVAGVLIITMCLTTYLTQRQIIGRQGPVDPSQRAQQRLFLYLAPGMLGFSGLLFPIGVLTYWLTTNLWSMGQQFFVLKKMPPPGSPGAAAQAKQKGEDVAPPPVRYQQVRRGEEPPEPPRTAAPEQGPRTPPPTPGPSRRPTGGRPQQRRRGKNRRGGRR